MALDSNLHFNPPILAHRGASAYAPENTLAAFRKAKALGASWVEFDIMLCATGELMVFHDESLERTTNGQGLLAEKDFAYLRTLDAGSWFSPAFAGEKIPTLKEVLQLLIDLPLAANIELKALPGQEQALVDSLLQDLESYYPKPLQSLLFSSFSVASLRALRARAPHYPLGFLLHEWFEGWEEVLQELKASTLNLNEALCLPEKMPLLQSKGLPLLAYTVNEPGRAKELFHLGLSALFSDCPDRLIAL